MLVSNLIKYADSNGISPLLMRPIFLIYPGFLEKSRFGGGKNDPEIPLEPGDLIVKRPARQNLGKNCFQITLKDCP